MCISFIAKTSIAFIIKVSIVFKEDASYKRITQSKYALRQNREKKSN